MLSTAARILLSRPQLLNRARHFHNCPDAIKRVLERQNVAEPTEIQKRTLPIALQNKDVVGIARTGSGKTLAFVIPAIIRALESRQGRNERENETSHPTHVTPSCLVLAPTRELANQTTSVIDQFGSLGIGTVALVGGSSRSMQLQALQRGNIDIFVATPGRLLDLVQSNCVDLSTIQYLVLDEADRMLDMGFEPQIRRILDKIPKTRQTLMWSATWPNEIRNLANEFMNSFEYIAVDSEELKANPNITQIVKVISPQAKLKTLIRYLEDFKQDHQEPRTIVFTNTKRMAEQLLIHLMRARIRAISIHGDRSQNQRDHAIRLFKNRLCNTLVATDVAARGLDISDINNVINFDFPNNIEDYIHRIGRTARHERKGTAISFVTENNANMAKSLIKTLRLTNQEVPTELEHLASMRNILTESNGSSRPRRRRVNDFYSTGYDDKFDNRYSSRQPYNPRRFNDLQSNDGYNKRLMSMD